MIPSVILRVDIPNAVEDSWYRGLAFVGLKEHCFEPSSPLRHATELDQVVRDDHNPILAIYTDGGPDHTTNLLSVQFALICIFLQEDRDGVFAVRTPPHNSWKDPVEQVTSVLNFGTQPCKVLLADVFRRLTYSKIPIQIFEPATSESIDNLWSQMSKIDPTLYRGDTTRAIV